MRGEDLDQVFVRTTGLTCDRLYAFEDPAKNTNFPWVTSREVPEMLLCEPKLLNPPGPDKKFPEYAQYELEVAIPGGTKYLATDPRLVTELETRWRRKLRLRFSEGGMHDSRPVSILGASSLKQLEQEVSMPLNLTRFRANFYVEWNDPAPFFEEALLGKTIQIGDKVRVHVSKRNKRCVVITLDPETAKPTPQILKHVGQKYQGLFGVYGVVVDDGLVKNGDSIALV